VLVEGGVVKAVGLDLAVPSDALRLDATGKFVMPGTPGPLPLQALHVVPCRDVCRSRAVCTLEAMVT
jgi:hypothetical protein